ncbi:arsenate reductase (glutaredoxin) [Flavobacterium sp.]|uniref:arsenate reductase (glutaredoxin) n=1 Tax=Flavobacterium sp. TaxID=239 RepID=UPI002616EDC4|nr:arsenate reductase (glutaredoxin) [Flavobacterium sp.]
MITIYHNTRCTKSRECLAFLEDSHHKFHIVKYLEQPPTFEELSEIIRKLNIKPIELVRQKESVWIEQYKDKKMTDKKIIEAMVSHPILIERPIVINGEKAVIARPFEKAKSII